MTKPPDAPRDNTAALSPERWARVRALVEEALALPPEARPAFLDASCGDDDALRSRVERLAAACERTGESWGFLAHAAGELVAPLLVADGTVMVDPAARADGPPAAFCAALADRYAVGAELGRGGMATVYVAEDLRHHRRVALKVLDPHLGAMLGAERFLSEIRITAGLQQPNLVPLFDSGEAGGMLYYVMPLIEGATLRARLQRERRLPVDEAVGIVRTIASALDYAHRNGVVHRDLKPENILLQDGQPLVADFGISLAVTNAADTRLTAATKALGTPQYMSPEQVTVDAAVDSRSDTYSLACVLYELLVGEPPFTGGTTQDVIARVLAERPSSVRALRPTVPAHVDAAIARALSKLPADRFATAREFADAIGLAPISVRGGRTAWWRDPARMFLGAAAIVALVTAVWVGSHEPAALPTRLAVLPLENRTADPALEEWGEYAADLLTRRIDLAARVDVIPASTVRDAIRALGATTAPSAAAVATRTGASHVMTGTMASVGGSIRIDVEFVDARSVKRLLSPDPISGPTDSLEAVIDRLAERTAAASLALFEPRPGWMGGYTLPTTIGMYRDYNATFQLFCHSRYSEVIATGNRVLAKSPDFIPVMGLVRFAYWNVGRTTEADSVHFDLEQLRDRMTASERVEHDWMGGLIDGDTSLAARSAEEMFQIDPSSKYGFAAGFTAFRMRRLEDALQRFLAADLDLPCQSAWFPWWNYTAATYHLLDRFEDEVRLKRRASARFPDHTQLLDMELRAAAATGRYGALDSVLAQVAGLPPPPAGGLAFGRLATNAALELRAHGHGERADRFIQRALEWFARRSPSEYRFERGLAFIAAGRWTDADTLFAGVIRDAPATDNSTYVSYLGYRGVALANLGRRDDALEWSRRLERIPGRRVLTSYGSAARAAIAAALGDGDGAIRLLNDAFQHGYPYDIFMHQSPWWDPLRKRRDFEALVRPK